VTLQRQLCSSQQRHACWTSNQGQACYSSWTLSSLTVMVSKHAVPSQLVAGHQQQAAAGMDIQLQK
jgi:hypothetical protein